MIATDKQGCFNLMCQQDVPANEQKCYSIEDKECMRICEGYDLAAVLVKYVEHMEELAMEDGEYYRWSEDIVVHVDDETTLTRTVTMDTRRDSYDHGRFDYESTRI